MAMLKITSVHRAARPRQLDDGDAAARLTVWSRELAPRGLSSGSL
jgi:hypothetical protein